MIWFWMYSAFVFSPQKKVVVGLKSRLRPDSIHTVYASKTLTLGWLAIVEFLIIRPLLNGTVGKLSFNQWLQPIGYRAD